MPFDIRKQADGYNVFDQRTGESKGVSKSRPRAERHMHALISAEDDACRRNDSPGAPTSDGMVLDSSYLPTFGDSYVDGKRVPRLEPTPASTSTETAKG